MRTETPPLEMLLKDYAETINNPETSKAYLGDIKSLLPKGELLRTLEETDLGLVLDSMRENLLSSSFKVNTVKRKSAAFNSFIDFLIGEGYSQMEKIKESDFQGFQRAEPSSEFPTFTYEEYIKLMENIPFGGLSAARNRTIMSLSYNSGLTSYEMSKLNYPDFDTSDPEVARVKIKSTRLKNGARVVDLKEETLKEMERYEALLASKIERSEIENPCRPYFSVKNKDKMGERTIRRHIEQYGVNLRTLRNSYIGRLIRNGERLESIAQKAGLEKERARAIRKSFLAVSGNVF